MNDENAFRIVLLVLLAIMLPVGAFFRIRSQATRERLDRRQEGLFVMIGLRVTALVAFVGFAAYLIEPASMRWSAMPLPDWLRWGAVVPAAAAIAVMFWAFASLGRNLTDTVVTRREHHLVTNGPYRWVRHPLYTAWTFLFASWCLISANWFLGAAAAVVMLFLLVRTRREEALLIERFGDQYRAYMRTTGRFLPRIT